MNVLRMAVRVHKWLALIIGIQVMIWILGGLVMSALPIERVRGEHNIARHAPLMADPANLKTVEEAAAIAGFDTLESAALTHLAGAPAWRLESAGRTIVIDAVTGARLSPVDEALARTIARHDFAPEAEIEAAQLLNDPPSEYGPGGEVWQIRFADADQTRLYIDPDTGVVRARRSDTWRVFDLFWRLHVMDYDDGADFNHPLLIISAALGLLVALAGLVILFIRMRRSWMIWRASRSV